MSPLIVSPGLALTSPDKTVICALACIGIILKPIAEETVSSLDDVTTILTSQPEDGAPAARSLIDIVTA